MDTAVWSARVRKSRPY
ncbi:hypothetical protein F383_21775 [Gossypium arboreum]|uniref:Uncharacterized protein n=1 Tax=Gossypium arboreum TaxID=29729 RepID=A0A0B0NM57_GOSAR|nr:hypothetical protein F383_21775 [Gossypium arboreum]